MNAAIKPLLCIAVVLCVPLAGAQPAPDLSATTADGRRVVLKSDGTWRFAAAPAAKPAALEQAELELVGQSAIPGGCQFDLSLSNRMSYEIRSIIPDFKILRRGGALYVEHNVSFSSVLPGTQQSRPLRVMGLACNEIEKVQVAGGDRCVMGELNRYSDSKGACLERVRVKASDAVKFEK